MAILEEKPEREKFKFKPARKDILIDGNGIISMIEFGPKMRTTSTGETVNYAYVSTPVDGDMKYFYQKKIQPLPDQYPELYLIEAPEDQWILLNDDSNCGAWLVLRAYDETDTNLTRFYDKMLISLRQQRIENAQLKMEIFILNEQLESLHAGRHDDIIKNLELYKKIQAPGMFSPQVEGEGNR